MRASWIAITSISITSLSVASLWLAACGAPSSAPDSEPEAEAAPAIELLLLVTVDTLRADHLGAYGSDRGLSPRLDALAAESLVFERVYAPAPFTVPSVAAIHTGRYPTELGLRTNLSILPPDTATLANSLAEAGWRTAGVVSNFVLQGRTDVAAGFEVYDDTMTQFEEVRRWPERIADETTAAALRIFAAWHAAPSRPPLFLWVHYQDPHGPYTPPGNSHERFLAQERARDPRRLPADEGPFGIDGVPVYQQLGDEQEVAFYRASYGAEIAFMDEQVGVLLDAVEAKVERDALQVVFSADHGEAMGEHGFWFAHGHHLTDELLRVPLFVRAPGLAPGRRSDVASLVDLRPTLARLAAGLASPEDLAGRDLLAPDASSQRSVPLLSTLAAYKEQRWGIVDDGYKLILTHRDDLWNAELYREGREEVDLAAPAARVTGELRERLRGLRERHTSLEPERERPMSEELREQLEALGYLHGEPAEAP